MTDVILIDPAYGNKNSRPQLGTLCLAAILLESGFSVEILDFSVDSCAESRLVALIEGDVLCIGISTVIGPMLLEALKVARNIKNMRPDIPIVWGGIHPSTATETTLAHPLVDAVCIGEGETAFLRIVDALKRGNTLDQSPGAIVDGNQKTFFKSNKGDYVDLDSQPLAPYHLIDLSLYKKDKSQLGFFGLQGDRILSIETSRGCAYRCAYCANAAKKEKFRKMSPANVIRSIEHIVHQGIRSITINDDNFFVDKKRALQILERIVQNRWELELFVAVRADCLCGLDDKDFALMKAAGISMLGIGAESGSNRTLKMIQKDAAVEDTIEAAKKIARFGLKAWFHFIYGFPNETLEDFLQTYQAMLSIVEVDPFAQVNLNRLIPNPGTPIYQQCVAKGWPEPNSIEEWGDLIELHKYHHPAFIDPDIERWRADHLGDVRFPTADLPRLQ